LTPRHAGGYSTLCVNGHLKRLWRRLREATSWLTRRPEDLTEPQTLRLKSILARSPALQTTHELVRGFADILTHRHGHDLPAWMDQVEQAGSAALRSFVAGLRIDVDAVTAGLTLHWSSGPVEGGSHWPRHPCRVLQAVAYCGRPLGR
jgi:transposase